MEYTIRSIIREFLKNYDDLMTVAVNNQGDIIEEYQGTALLEKYQELYQDMCNKLTYNLLEIKENEFSNVLKKLYIYYYVLDERVFTILNNIMKDKPNWKIEVQMRLYMMYFKTLREAIFLLCGGFSDGALSRVRRMYEMGVYIEIINKNNDKLAERFWRHCNVQRFDMSKKLNDRQKTLKIRDKINRFHYENEFIKENGWANILFRNKEKIYFSDLLGLTDYKEHEGTYKYACNFVHFNMLSSLQSLDLGTNNRGKSIWNTSPSIEGIATVIDIIKLYIGLVTINYKNSFDVDAALEFFVFGMIESDNIFIGNTESIDDIK
jgi:hypothetical protein